MRESLLERPITHAEIIIHLSLSYHNDVVLSPGCTLHGPKRHGRPARRLSVVYQTHTIDSIDSGFASVCGPRAGTEEVDDATFHVP